jgi:predicted DNA-binding transcriptional regulator YafY
MYSIYDEKSKFISNVNIIEPDEKIKLIEAAINQNDKIEIVYDDIDGKKSNRVIHPLQMFYYKDGYYVTAFCELRNDIRHFEIKRISNIK